MFPDDCPAEFSLPVAASLLGLMFIYSLSFCNFHSSCSCILRVVTNSAAITSQSETGVLADNYLMIRLFVLSSASRCGADGNSEDG